MGKFSFFGINCYDSWLSRSSTGIIFYGPLEQIQELNNWNRVRLHIWKPVLFWFGTWFFFHIYWECHHPNWRSPSFFRGVGQPPTSYDGKLPGCLDEPIQSNAWIILIQGISGVLFFHYELIHVCFGHGHTGLLVISCYIMLYQLYPKNAHPSI